MNVERRMNVKRGIRCNSTYLSIFCLQQIPKLETNDCYFKPRPAEDKEQKFNLVFSSV